jgi:hypothetical protein
MHIVLTAFTFCYLYCICTGSTYRGDINMLHSIVRIIANTDAIYLSSYPHRQFPSINEISVNIVRPNNNNNDENNDEDNNDDDDNDAGINNIVDGDDDVDNNVDNDDGVDNNDVNEGVGDWNDVNTGNNYSSFELNDIVMGWFDDAFYTARIVENDDENELFTLLFLDDGMEVNSYKAQWIKHLE